MKTLSLSRRAVLKLSVILSGLFTLGGVLEFMSYQEPPEVATQITLDIPESYTIGSVTPVPEVRAWLFRDESGFYAVSGLCTHLGCTVAIKNGSHFECPCHGSEFDLQGAVLIGPAELPLNHVELTYSVDNKLVVNTQVVVPAAQRLAIN
ncbi:ubiquinol-cytochrome c reductase iron-sulfur subunit [Chloroflexota bacterium]